MYIELTTDMYNGWMSLENILSMEVDNRVYIVSRCSYELQKQGTLMYSSRNQKRDYIWEYIERG